MARPVHGRRAHRELSTPQWVSLAFGHVDGDDAFDDDEDRRAAWEIHRDELMQRNGTAVPGHRPAGFWDYDAPDAPAREDFLVPASWPFPGERVDSEALEEAELRYLAERGLLDEEIARLAAKAEEPYEAPDGVHRPRRRFDAVLDALSRPAA